MRFFIESRICVVVKMAHYTEKINADIPEKASYPKSFRVSTSFVGKSILINISSPRGFLKRLRGEDCKKLLMQTALLYDFVGIFTHLLKEMSNFIILNKFHIPAGAFF